MFDDQTEPQLVPKWLLQVSVRELHNILVSDPNDGGLKDARDENGKIVISDSTLRLLLPPQLIFLLHVTRLCVVVNVAFLIKVYIHNCYPGVIGVRKNSRIKAKMLKAEGLVRNHITYIQHIIL